MANINISNKYGQIHTDGNGCIWERNQGQESFIIDNNLSTFMYGLFRITPLPYPLRRQVGFTATITFPGQAVISSIRVIYEFFSNVAINYPDNHRFSSLVLINSKYLSKIEHSNDGAYDETFYTNPDNNKASSITVSTTTGHFSNATSGRAGIWEIIVMGQYAPSTNTKLFKDNKYYNLAKDLDNVSSLRAGTDRIKLGQAGDLLETPLKFFDDTTYPILGNT